MGLGKMREGKDEEEDNYKGGFQSASQIGFHAGKFLDVIIPV